MKRAAPAIRSAVLVFGLFAAAAFAHADDPLVAAMDAYKSGDYEKAAELASAVPADDPERLRAAYMLGEADLLLSKWVGAEKAFREVLEKKANSVPALVGLGRAQIGGGSPLDAIVTLEKATKIDAKDAGARRALGEARYANGDADKARADLEAAVKLDPKDPLASRSLVEVLIKTDKVDAAAKEAERIAKAIPEHPMGHFLHAYVLDRQGRDKDAIEEYEKAIAKDDKFLDAHKNLAILCVARNPSYGDKERTKKAMDHFERYFALGCKDQALKDAYEQIKAFLESQKPATGK
ncbi:MAG: tetratricopeptide repeat protein [Planctomycetes bacterium]|nr:tetratricopeptide repeat protein [Planctomycetota bacterium]